MARALSAAIARVILRMSLLLSRAVVVRCEVCPREPERCSIGNGKNVSRCRWHSRCTTRTVSQRRSDMSKDELEGKAEKEKAGEIVSSLSSSGYDRGDGAGPR